MLVLILFLIVGGVTAYVAQYNLTPVSLSLGHYVLPPMPLFYVIIGSLLLGLGTSYVIYLVHAVSMEFKMRDKDQHMKKVNEEVLQLTKRVHQLELENEKLKKNSPNKPKDPNAL